MLKEEKIFNFSGKKKDSVRRKFNVIFDMRETMERNRHRESSLLLSHNLQKIRDRSEEVFKKKKIRRSGNFNSKFFFSEVPTAMKFEDRSSGETTRQERYVRGDTWQLVKKISQLKKIEKATFYSSSDEWIMSFASTTNPEERVLDSRVNIHMISKS